MDNKLELRLAIGEIVDRLTEMGYEMPDSLKRRDKREPGRLEKERMEDRLFMVMRRHFKKQLIQLKERLEQNYPSRKNAGIPPIPIDDIINGEDDDEYVASVIRVIGLSATGGVNLFKENINLGIDYTLINDRALDWARNYTYDLIGKRTGGIDATTREAVSNAIQRFVDTPGFTIGDAVDQLSSYFSDTRARMIATTEITRAYGHGNQIAAEKLKEDFPDVRVVKIWHTNNDDRVCDICGPLEGKEVEVNEDFDTGIDNPPAHINCRCFSTMRTRI
jgi:SPP1 gp7 family putative phage head morphogenesis protein